jgi:alpha-1,2-mannosyltransferase
LPSAEGRARATRSSSAAAAEARFNQGVARSRQLGDRVRGFARPWELACFLWIPALVLGFTSWYELRNQKTLGDFPIFRAASKAVLHGHSPYVPPSPHALANFDTFVYPPAAAFLFSPFAVIPYQSAKALMVVLSIASVLLALRLLGVEDWRCYGVAAVSAPVVSSLALGALTSFLLLGAAATWRHRDRPAFTGVTAALTATAKLFLWPLGLWLLVTKRMRAAAIFAATTLALLVGGWAAIAFGGLRDYPHLLRLLTQLESHRSFSVVALFKVSGTATTVLSALLAFAVVGAVAAAARSSDGERRAYAVAVIGALVSTPVVWMHYYVLLFVPIALYRRRLSAAWLLPLAFWVVPSSYSEGATWRILIGLGVTAAVGSCLIDRRIAASRRRILGAAAAK